MQQNYNITAPFDAPNLSTTLFQEYPSIFQDNTFNKNDPYIKKAIFKKGKGGCVRVF